MKHSNITIHFIQITSRQTLDFTQIQDTYIKKGCTKPELHSHLTSLQTLDFIHYNLFVSTVSRNKSRASTPTYLQSTTACLAPPTYSDSQHNPSLQPLHHKLPCTQLQNSLHEQNKLRHAPRQC
ncbi:hypothetical protein E2C01_068743 [Portunus trituberculatus]|uniref:Uncharacterized protein n=1 Tax=Portunus trituberculatus TaxID=210409 RepID=A0A5B7HX06_PORTR|nr:hypothetical protein [Portunus trituberculatus]